MTTGTTITVCDAEVLEAAERALKFLSNQVAGRYNSPNEDQLCGEALARALAKYHENTTDAVTPDTTYTGR